jgi:hypothetical protein
MQNIMILRLLQNVLVILLRLEHPTTNNGRPGGIENVSRQNWDSFESSSNII